MLDGVDTGRGVASEDGPRTRSKVLTGVDLNRLNCDDCLPSSDPRGRHSAHASDPPRPISASQLSLKQKTLQKRLTQIEYH